MPKMTATTLFLLALLSAAPAEAQKTIEVWPNGAALVDGQQAQPTKHVVCWALEQSTDEWDTILCHAGNYPPMTVGGKPGPWNNAWLPGGIVRVEIVGMMEDLDGDGTFERPRIPDQPLRQSVLTLAQDGPPGPKPKNAYLRWIGWDFGGGYRYCVEGVFDQVHDYDHYDFINCRFIGNGKTLSGIRWSCWYGEVSGCYFEDFREHAGYSSNFRGHLAEPGERGGWFDNMIRFCARTGIQEVDRDIGKDPTTGAKRPGTGRLYVAGNVFDYVGCNSPNAPANNCGSFAMSLQGHAGTAESKGQVVVRNNQVLSTCNTGALLIRGESTRGHRYKDESGAWVYVGGATIAGNEFLCGTSTVEHVKLAGIGQLNLGRNVLVADNNVGIQLDYAGGGGSVREIVGWQMEPGDGFWEQNGGTPMRRRDNSVSKEEIAAMQKEPAR